MKPLPRDYVSLAGYAKFSDRFRNFALAGGPINAALKALTAPLQSKVFPFAEPACSGAATNFGLVWLYDQPQRAANNRTMRVSSWFDGAQWSEPAPVADDGTADFHPQLLAFADGSAVTVWGNEAAALPTTATFDDMKTGLEVSAAFYDPASRTWQTAQRLTTNTHLDRNPKIAGPNRNDVMVVWVSNAANELNGSATKPNQIWFAKLA